jgi:hypothetical protein
MGMPRGQRVVPLMVGAGLLALALSGCVNGTPTPVPTYTPTSSASATPDAGPTLHPGGTAAENLQFFDVTNQAFYAAHGKSDGRSIIDNLVAAGFRKQDMEVTPDQTSIGEAADSIVFSVRVKGECLIGQFSASGYTGTLGPMLGTGSCLVGTTRPIDW